MQVPLGDRLCLLGSGALRLCESGKSVSHCSEYTIIYFTMRLVKPRFNRVEPTEFDGLDLIRVQRLSA
jgi:hypothetical protein